jgi:hypothetical protein
VDCKAVALTIQTLVMVKITVFFRFDHDHDAAKQDDIDKILLHLA